jgi:hypothetical protein
MDVSPVSSLSHRRFGCRHRIQQGDARLRHVPDAAGEQMKNQDPTEPMDATEQIAQLATFSQVEQTIQTNKNLEELLQSSSLSQAGIASSGVPSPAPTKPFPASSEEVQVYSTDWLLC